MRSAFSTRRGRTAPSHRATFKPRLEALEERDTPSAFAASAASPDFSGQLLGSGQGVGTDAFGNVYTVGYVGGTINASDTDG
jgi:hypothetical protein